MTKDVFINIERMIVGYLSLKIFLGHELYVYSSQGLWLLSEDHRFLAKRGARIDIKTIHAHLFIRGIHVRV